MTQGQQTELMKRIQAARRLINEALAIDVEAGDYTTKLVDAEESLEDALHAVGKAVVS